MFQLLFIIPYFFICVGSLVFFIIVLWRAMRAHESIAESMKIVAEQMGKKSQT